MSTFEGRILEIDNISVDNFQGQNIHSYAYFLSHCHTDHMRGLNNPIFQDELLNKKGVYLYASTVSVEILKNLHPKISVKLKSLPIETPTLISLPMKKEKFSVTLIPAGHCPGSVMFLFETEQRILYTGDFRINPSDLTKIKAFYSLNELKKINKIYLDTTFFKKDYFTFPTRQESLEKLCFLIKEWVEKGKEYLVQLNTSARYGSEYLFMGIYENLGIPVHVNQDAYNFYKHIPEMDKSITTNSKNTQLHSACGYQITGICQKVTVNNLRKIKPCALSFKGHDFSKGIVTLCPNETLKVCYSCHPSYEETQRFIELLKPDEIEACVVPDSKIEKEIMLQTIKEMLNVKEDTSGDSAVKFFKTDRQKKHEDGRGEDKLETEKHSKDLDNILASPTKNFKRRRL